MARDGGLTIANGTGLPAPRNLFARVAKVRSASDFNGDAAMKDGTDKRAGAHVRRPAPSHSGTTEYAPLWYGPRLRPAFVAQVLGQILYPETCDPHPALAAYDESGKAPLAAVLNRTI